MFQRLFRAGVCAFATDVSRGSQIAGDVFAQISFVVHDGNRDDFFHDSLAGFLISRIRILTAAPAPGRLETRHSPPRVASRWRIFFNPLPLRPPCVRTSAAGGTGTSKPLSLSVILRSNTNALVVMC